MSLEEKQFELGGIAFGLDCPIEIKADGFTPGSPELRTNDVNQAVGDGVRMGRDTKGAAVWSFSLYTNAKTESEAWANLSALAAIWDSEEIRSNPDAVLPLRYTLAGQSRIVYGRPRRWTPTVQNTSMNGRIDIEADFTVVDHRVYSDSEHTFLVPLGVPLELDAGIEVPLIPPFFSDPGSFVREDSITIGGEVATPIIIRFDGPVANARITVGTWIGALIDSVADGEYVTMDARPWVRSVTTSRGGAARVSPRITRLTKLWLPPGHHQVTFTGDDPTGSATALVSWHDAYLSPSR